MSKRVSASAPALPIDSSDLSHLDQPLKPRIKRKIAPAELHPRPHGVGDPRATGAHGGSNRFDIGTTEQAPQCGALVKRREIPAISVNPETMASEQTMGFSHGKRKSSTKSASPVLAKAHAPRVLKPSRRSAPIPSHLPEMPEIYAMQTDGDCMVPEIRDGQKIIVSKTEEVKRGDTVCLWLKNPSRPEGYSALVKKVAMLPPPHVTFPYVEHPESEIEALVFVEQINPPRTYRFKCEDVLAMHKVIDVQAEDSTSVMTMPEPSAPKHRAEQRPTPYGILEAYKTWLGLELRHLCGEMAGDAELIAARYPSLENEPDIKKRADAIGSIFSFIGRSGHWHFGRDDRAMDRAALILNAVGCDWREVR